MLLHDDIKCWQGCGATGTLIHCSGNAKWHSTLESNLRVSYKMKHTLIIQSCTPATALLGIYPKEFTTCNHTNLYMMYIVALFIILKTWKQP